MVYLAADLLHPLDLAARQQLENIPLLKQAVKKYLGLVAERRDRHALLSNAVRLGPRQMPDIYRLLPPICEAFGIPQPDLFLTRGPANAYTAGETHTSIVITNELISDLNPDEICAVLAHECGHIMAQHVLYRQMALAVVGAGENAGVLGSKIGAAASLTSLPLKMALLNWYRKSELTADRAAALYVGGAEPMQRAIFRIIGVPKWVDEEHVSLAEFITQADEFDILSDSSRWDRYLARELERGSTHPIPIVRVREVARWVESTAFRQLLDGNHLAAIGQRPSCPSCAQVVEVEWVFCQHCGERMASVGSAWAPEDGSY